MKQAGILFLNVGRLALGHTFILLNDLKCFAVIGNDYQRASALWICSGAAAALDVASSYSQMDRTELRFGNRTLLGTDFITAGY